MRTTTRLVLAFGLTACTVTAASAQTPPTPTPTPDPPAAQQPAPEQPKAQPEPAQPAASQPSSTVPRRSQDRPGAAARPRYLLSANGGFQIGPRDYETSTTFDVFEETATLGSTGEVKNGLMFDVGLSYMLNDEYAVGVSYSFFTSESDTAVIAQVPHPLITDQIRTATFSATGLNHNQSALHFQGIWMIPFTTDLDFAVSAGPSLVFTSLDVVSAANLLPETSPFTSPTIDSVTVNGESKTAFGINLGVDAIYRLSPRYGAGVTARYVWAKADIDGLSDSLTVGGLQILGGVRVRF